MTEGHKTGSERRCRTVLAGAAAMAAVLVAAIPNGGARAAPLNLQTLIDTKGAITVGDKRFSGFTCAISASSGAAAPNACNQINVVTADNAPVGLTFQSSFVTIGAVFKDVLLGYTVDVLDPNQKIRAIDLAFNGEIFGQAIAQVTETAFAAGNSPVGQTQVINTQQGAILRNTFALNGSYSSLEIRKDVLLGSQLANGTATISFIDQRFEQTAGPSTVPEPATLATLGTGLLGFGLLRQRRRRFQAVP